jgi:hypothetical protein
MRRVLKAKPSGQDVEDISVMKEEATTDVQRLPALR